MSNAVLSQLFLVPTRKPRTQRQIYLAVVSGSTILCVLLLHLFWFSYFWSQDFPRMVVANGAGFILFALLFLFNRQENIVFASVSMTVLSGLYGAFATVSTGWDTGCQWFLLVTLLPHYLYLDSHPTQRNWLTLTSLGFLLFCYFVSHATPGAYIELEYVVLRFVNTLLVFLLPLLQILIHNHFIKALRSVPGGKVRTKV